jgi:hypothetical protein
LRSGALGSKFVGVRLALQVFPTGIKVCPVLGKTLRKFKQREVVDCKLCGQRLV